LSEGYTPLLFAFYPLHNFGWGEPGRNPEEICSCSKLHPGEFTLPQTSRPRGALLPHLFTLAKVVSRETTSAVYFLWHCSSNGISWEILIVQISLAPYPVVSGLSSLNDGLVLVLRTNTKQNFTERLLLSAFILSKLCQTGKKKARLPLKKEETGHPFSRFRPPL